MVGTGPAQSGHNGPVPLMQISTCHKIGTRCPRKLILVLKYSSWKVEIGMYGLRQSDRTPVAVVAAQSAHSKKKVITSMHCVPFQQRLLINGHILCIFLILCIYNIRYRVHSYQTNQSCPKFEHAPFNTELLMCMNKCACCGSLNNSLLILISLKYVAFLLQRRKRTFK